MCEIDQQKYSLLRKLLRITVYCLKFIKQRVWMTLSPVQKERFCKNHVLVHKVFSHWSTNSFVCSEDIKLATTLWIYCIQHYRFKDVLIAIQMRKNHCLNRQLGLWIDDVGILRCQGRFLNATITEVLNILNYFPDPNTLLIC